MCDFDTEITSLNFLILVAFNHHLPKRFITHVIFRVISAARGLSVETHLKKFFFNDV